VRAAAKAPGAAETEALPSRATQKPEWLLRLERGRQFNVERSVGYPHNELYINKPGSESGYYRLDSYNPATGEIVSRKFTQLSTVSEQTAIRYVNELSSKYPAGAIIADVPSSAYLAGQPLWGQKILEVPVQTVPVPRAVLDAADKAGVVIRDVAGKLYE
jgi:hypothetical protein